jgi:hypothetical protein
MKANVPESANCRFTSTLVTPAKSIRKAAIPHAESLKFWEYDEFRTFAANALQTIRILRQSFYEAGDLVWQNQAADSIKENRLDLTSIIEDLNKHPVVENLTEI